MKLFQIAILAGMACACSLKDVRADDAAEERERALQRVDAILQEAAELQETGHGEQAKRLLQEAAELRRGLEQEFERAERPETHEIESILREAEELEAAGRADEADRLRAEAAELKRAMGREREGREPAGEHEGFRRLEHVRQAIEHLREAGLHDLAHATAEHAEEMERDLHRAMEQREHAELEQRERTKTEQQGERPAHLAELHELLAALRDEVAALRREVGELRERAP